MAQVMTAHALGTTEDFGIPGIDGQTAPVLSFDTLTADQSVVLRPHSGASVTNWVLGMDVYIPADSASGFTGLVQTDSGDAQEGLRLFTDDDGETSPGYVSSLFFLQGPPAAADLAAMAALAGGPSAAGFFPASPAPGAIEVDFADAAVNLRYGEATVRLEGSDTAPAPVVQGDSVIGLASQLGIERPGGADIPVLMAGGFGPDEHLSVRMPLEVDVLTSFTAVWDINIRSAPAGFLALLQLSADNGDDADLFVDADGGLGIGGRYDGQVTFGEWSRIAISVSDDGDGTSTLAKYIDGALVGEQTVPTARFTLTASQDILLLTDNDGEVGSSALAHFGLMPRAMTAEEIAELGGVDADGPFAANDPAGPDGAPLTQGGDAIDLLGGATRLEPSRIDPAGPMQIGFDNNAPTPEFGFVDSELADEATLVNGLKDQLVSLKDSGMTFDLAEAFGPGARDFTVATSNSEAVSATIADGVMTLEFGGYGLADLVISATGPVGQAMTDEVRFRVAGENAHTIAILPDTQDYTYNANLNQTFVTMTQWLADNAGGKNLGFVTHVGDITPMRRRAISGWPRKRWTSCGRRGSRSRSRPATTTSAPAVRPTCAIRPPSTTRSRSATCPRIRPSAASMRPSLNGSTTTSCCGRRRMDLSQPGIRAARRRSALGRSDPDPICGPQGNGHDAFVQQLRQPPRPAGQSAGSRGRGL